MSGQLPLPLPATASFAPADFIADLSNEGARRWLAQPASWPDSRLALHGPEGVGKTHLLRMTAAARGWAVSDGAALSDLPELPALGWVIDDADAAPEPSALLHAMNAAREARLPLLLAARAPPARWGFALPDLVSRLRATTAVAVEEPGDGLLRAVLAKLLADRQIALRAELQARIITQLPRRAGAIAGFVARLDAASLAAGKLNQATVQSLLRDISMDEVPPAAGLG